jgi:tetratricopeptide (TPR) repeat protein
MPGAKTEPTPETVLASESANLFVDRARALQPHFSVNASNAATLASICRRLDGIALAIELAAPRVLSMSLEEIGRRLDRRFSLLTNASSDVVPRQRTLRSMIDWSYELLSHGEQALLCGLSVFSGGWTFEAMPAVCAGRGVEPAQLPDFLASLVEKNLVLREERTGHTRYRLLETIRQYARDRSSEDLPERMARNHAHLAYFAALGAESLIETEGEHQVAWFETLDAEHDNLRAALAWSLGEGNNTASGMTIAGSIWRFWRSRGFLDEGLAWASRLLAADPDRTPSARLGNVLTCAGNLALHQASFASARGYFERAMGVRHAIGDRLGVGRSLNSLGMVAGGMGEAFLARQCFEESLDIMVELGEQHEISNSLIWLGNMSEGEGDYPAALAMYEKSLGIKTALGDQSGLAIIQCNMGVILGHQGDHLSAMKSFVRSLQILHALRDVMWVGACLEEMAPSAGALGNFELAARLWGAAEKLREVIGESVMSSDRVRYEANAASARNLCPEPVAFARAWDAGRAMDWEQAVTCALETRGVWSEAL